MIHHTPLAIALVTSALIVLTLPDTLTALVVATPILIAGYIASALVKVAREGVLADERDVYIARTAKATAYEATLVTAGILALIQTALPKLGMKPPEALGSMGILVLLAIVYYALAYALYTRKNA